MTSLYIFVEGYNDEQFVETILRDTIMSKYNYYKIIQYAQQGKKKVNDYISSIESMHDSEYIFLADQDGNNDKKNVILNKYSKLSADRVYLSVFEIESWIYAGVSSVFIKKRKINSNVKSSLVTKESFERIFNLNNYSLEEIKQEIYETYDIKKAVSNNNSFKCFYNFFK